MLTSLSIGRGGLGRMGNQMWTIAGVIGIAIKSGQPYGFPDWVNVDNANFGGSIDNLNNELENRLPEIPEGIHFRDYGYFWGYRDVNLPTGNWSIDAHLQSEKFFSHCLPLIKKTFTFNDEPEQTEDVAVHFRAGDYTEGISGHHPRQTKEYYKKAMDLFPDSEFVVYSDDIFAWVEMMEEDKRDWSSASDDNTYLEDFKDMKKCKHFITSNSSFSSFAAILGDHPEKKVIQPSQWFGESMPDVWRLNTEDLYHKGAIVI